MRFASRVVPVLVAIVLAGCGGREAQGPAWPKTAEPETDGGESLAPRQATAIATADEDEKKPVSDVPPAAAAKAEPTVETPAAAPTQATPIVTMDEDEITVEEIVIEITDDD